MHFCIKFDEERYSIPEKRQLRSVNLCGLALSACQLAPEEKNIIIGSWDNNMYLILKPVQIKELSLMIIYIRVFN